MEGPTLACGPPRTEGRPTRRLVADPAEVERVEAGDFGDSVEVVSRWNRGAAAVIAGADGGVPAGRKNAGIGYRNSLNQARKSFATVGVSLPRRHWSAARLITSAWVG